jgi:hypothetical protein
MNSSKATRRIMWRSSAAWRSCGIASTTMNHSARLWVMACLELRHVGKLNTRVMWFFIKRRRIIAVPGIRNKGQAIPSRDLETARERMRDWQQRFER